MNILVIGSGSAAKRHLRIVAEEYGLGCVYWLPSITANANVREKDFGANIVSSLSEATKLPLDIVIVANPAPWHIDTARPFLNLARAILIEKPLALSSVSVSHFLAEIESVKATVLVGYQLRFSKALEFFTDSVKKRKFGKSLYFRAEVAQYLPHWRRDRDYRRTVTASKRLSGGLPFELSHEFDYLLRIFGNLNVVNSAAYRLSDLEIDIYDHWQINLVSNANIRKKCLPGGVCLDINNKLATRKCLVVKEDGVIIWDGIEKTVTSTSTNGVTEVVRFDAELDVDINYKIQFASLLCGDYSRFATVAESLDTIRLAERIDESNMRADCLEVETKQNI